MYKGVNNPNYGNRGTKSPLFKGERKIKHGYVYLYRPDHEMSDSDGWIREHRLVMAEYLGRSLSKNEDVHHKDGNKQNNDISNLEVLTRSEHTSLHNKEKEIIRDELGRIKSVIKRRAKK